ncbi:MAG: aldehyde dehydrogenase [Oscillospiraceae bacterium]|nr:aldehyde dehydrogenase [Oscillospiraceae bacterium]
MNIHETVQAQRAFFRTGATFPVEFRVQALQTLRDAIRAREDDIAAALWEDLGKSDYESYLCETGLALSEVSYLIRNTPRYARPIRVRTPLSQFPARSYRQPTPYGNTLILSPWNYPFLLAIDPLADAIAAGNTAIVKPSAYSPATSQVVKDLIGDCFPPEYVAVVTGGREENTALLEEKYDLVFFTGSQAVGKTVLRKAAETLTPAVLELGGKSPCIVDETAKLDLAARRIVFGKFLNCGQTCVAPDYILCHSSVKARLLAALEAELHRQFGADPLENPDYGRIISEKHFDRLCALLPPDTSPRRETLQIPPTVLPDTGWDDPVMEAELFGPILPVLTYEAFDEVYDRLADRPKPLALYLFTEDRRRADEVMTHCRFGGGCVNDVVIHLATSEMPFGGVGESGMGGYHGRAGFEAFSHTKSIVDKKTWLDLPMRYQPYRRDRFGPILRQFLK